MTTNTRTPSRPGRRLVGFPTARDPRWTPEQRTRWETAVQIAADHPGTPGQGGWSVDRLPAATGALVGLAVTLLGGLASIVVAVLVGTAVSVLLGIAGIVASGIAGMAVVWHTPPADLAVRITTPRPRPARPALAPARRARAIGAAARVRGVR